LLLSAKHHPSQSIGLQISMGVNAVVGNTKPLHQLCDWLNKYYNTDETDIPAYAIIYGSSGNGKTFIVENIAESMKVELFRITPFDIETTDDLNNIIKSLNMKTLQGSSYKLICIDDIDEYKSSYTQKLLELCKISKNPIIYTTKTYSLDKDFIKNSLLVRVKKPLTSQLVTYLKEKAITLCEEHIIEEIARKSKSVRSAQLALYNYAVNEMIQPNQTMKERFTAIKNRVLVSNLTKHDIFLLYASLKGYDADTLRVRHRLANFDYRVRGMFEKPGDEEIEPYIDEFFVNLMNEPIEKVSFSYKQKEKKKKKLILPNVKNNIPKEASIEKWI